MPTTTQPTIDSQTGSSISDSVSDAMHQAKNKISDLGSAAADNLDQNRSAAATGLKSAASSLHENADGLPGGAKVSNIAHSAADKMSATADYVREHDISSMMNDVENIVKKNPGPTLFFAAVLGFLIGRTFSDSRG